MRKILSCFLSLSAGCLQGNNGDFHAPGRGGVLHADLDFTPKLKALGKQKILPPTDLYYELKIWYSSPFGWSLQTGTVPKA